MQNESREYGYLISKISSASFQVQCKTSEIQNTNYVFFRDKGCYSVRFMDLVGANKIPKTFPSGGKQIVLNHNTELTLGLSKFSSSTRQTDAKIQVVSWLWKLLLFPF